MAEGLEGAELVGFDDGRGGEFFLKGGENFDALDGIDAEVGIEAHVEREHFHRVAGFLGDDGEEGAGEEFGGGVVS